MSESYEKFLVRIQQLADVKHAQALLSCREKGLDRQGSRLYGGAAYKAALLLIA